MIEESQEEEFNEDDNIFDVIGRKHVDKKAEKEKRRKKEEEALPDTDYENLMDHMPFSPRGIQDQVLAKLQEFLLNDNIKAIVVEAPVGAGKSFYAMTAALASKSAYIITANKMLQDQYIRDFHEIMKSLKGRSNYKCNTHSTSEYYNCSNSPCRKDKDTRKKCNDESACEFHSAVGKAASAKITNFNFASALAFFNSSRFKLRNLLIIDEAHNTVPQVSNFIELIFNRKELVDLKLMPENMFLPDYEDINSYKSFFLEIAGKCGAFLEKSELDPTFYNKLEQFSKKLLLFSSLTEALTNIGNFVLDKEKDNRTGELLKLRFAPVEISSVLHDFLLEKGMKTIFMSATILDMDTFIQTCGLKPSEVACLKVGSSFPKENRPIYTHKRVGSINMKNLEQMLPAIVKNVDEILDAHPNVKGIIHGHTYRICLHIATYTKHKDRILFPAKSVEQGNVLKQHLESNRPTVLLSPSMTEGVDLKDDASRLQIIVKTPFPYLGDPILKARMLLYPNYYNMITALTLAQAYGRSIRSETDTAITYLLDSATLGFIKNNQHIMPSWFLDAVHW